MFGAVTDEIRRAQWAARRVLRGHLVERRSHTVGLPPGSLPAPAEGAPPPRVTAFQYGPDLLEEAEGLSAAEARAFADRPGVAWINVDGVTDTAAIAAFGEAFGLHPLAVEDVVRTTQRPKMEVYGDHVFVVVRSVRTTEATPEDAYCADDDAEEGHVIEQISFVLGPDFVLSFQEDEGDVFDALRERIRRGAGRVRSAGADYLLSALLDLVVDHTFVTLERMGDATETLEALALDDPDPSVQVAISRLRREVALLRRAMWPLRDVLIGLGREDTPLI
ncbi:MAG TPA: CorA family divalent cation transporter, partial [Rubricoccaceae bacterium]